MDLVDAKALLTGSKAGVSTLGLRKQEQFTKQDQGKIKKLVQEEQSSIKVIYPIELSFGFHPFTGDDDTFDAENRYISPISATTTVLALKEAMKENKELHAFYAKFAGKSAEDYILTPGVVTEMDEEIFGKFRRPVHYSALTQTFRFEAFGQFGRKYLCKIDSDANNNITSASIGYWMSLLERDFFFEERKAIVEQYAEGGPKFGLPEKDMTEDIKAAAKRMRVTQPRYTGVLTHLTYNLNYGEETFKETAVMIKKNSMDKYHTYSSGSSDDLSRVKAYLNTAVDVHFDFIEVNCNLASLDDVEENQKALAAYTKRSFQTNPRSPICEHIVGFADLYRTFRDDPDNFSEKAVFGTVPAFKFANDELLVENYKAEYMIRKRFGTKESLVAHEKLIKQLDTADASKALDHILSGATDKVVHDAIDKTNVVAIENDDIQVPGLDIAALASAQSGIVIGELK